MYPKRAMFSRANSALSISYKCRSSSEMVERIHKVLRNLSTAVERLDFLNSDGYPTEDSSLVGSNMNPRADIKGSQNRTGSFGEVSDSVEQYSSGFQQSKNTSVVETQSQIWSSNHGRREQSWHQNSSMSTSQVQSHYQGNLNSNSRQDLTRIQQNFNTGNYTGSWQNTSYGTNSDYQNGGSSWDSGETFDGKINVKIKEFDAFCKQDNLKVALTTMEALEKMGHFLDLARLLRLAQLCGEEEASQEIHALQEIKVAVQSKISASVYHLDPNLLKYHTDVVVEEFDAYCKQGKVKKALSTIDTLASMSHIVDLTRLLRLAKLCGEVEALEEAKVVHGKISASVCHLDASSYHVLIEMYSNCGLVNEALSVFEKMHEKNLKTWYSIIRCFAKNGLGEDAIDMFTRFKKEGNKPDCELFRGIFYACGVLGDVDEGLLHFESMSKDYGIIPSMEHYVSIVEMFALPGLLDEALEFVEKMPVEASVDVWETLMNLSRVHGDLELGDRCAELVEELDPTRLNKQSREGYLAVKTSDVVKESLKKRSGTHALPGIKSRIHEYKAGDTNLPENDQLLELLRNLKMHMLERGYVADTKPALHDVDQESKESALLGHSERIAFVRAVLNTAPRSSITIMKNLRVCIDCHNALKIMADIVGRVVVMRDAKRFHHIKDGACSCNDYW